MEIKKMKIANYKIKSKHLIKIAEQLSDNGYNPDWENNSDKIGDWVITYVGNCEAISIPSHDGFGDQVSDCFMNDCDKPKEITWRISRYEKVIIAKEQYNKDFTDSDADYLWELEEKNMEIS
tara:strand:- start:912 stop:1277 length:366 start_codon:yes stop_codon:yes gene_type:complete